MICGPATPRGDALLAAHNATCRSLWSNGSDGPVRGETSCRLQTDAGVEMDGGLASSNPGVFDASIGWERAKAVSGILGLGTTDRPAIALVKLNSPSLEESGTGEKTYLEAAISRVASASMRRLWAADGCLCC